LPNLKGISEGREADRGMCKAIYGRRRVVEFLALLPGKWDGLGVGKKLGLTAIWRLSPFAHLYGMELGGGTFEP